MSDVMDLLERAEGNITTGFNHRDRGKYADAADEFRHAREKLVDAQEQVPDGTDRHELLEMYEGAVETLIKGAENQDEEQFALAMRSFEVAQRFALQSDEISLSPDDLV